MAPFAKSTTTEWSLNNKVLEGMAVNGKVLEGTAAGVFGVKWDQNNLYFAVKTNGKTLSLTVNGKQITVDENNSAAANGITTVTVPYTAAELTAPTAYGAEISAKVTLGTAAWEGVLVLTSNEAFEVEGEAQRTIGQQYSGTGVAVQNGGAATAKQKVEKTADGWHFMDHYNKDGSNPIQTRGYLILWGFRQSEEAQERYANFNDRTRSTYLEFDFQATAMPV